MSRQLMEAINVPGAEYIGTSKGYDLFDIRTYEAAQQFVIENTTSRAGQAYTQNETTFNSNINENQRLYFFVESNTNKVFAGAVKDNNTNSNINIVGKKESIQINVNFLFETNNANSTNKIFPLFLIPGANVRGASGSMIIIDGKLQAVLPQLVPDESIDLDLSVLEINTIADSAFYYNMPINNLIIGDNIEYFPEDAFDDVNHIKITWLEKPDSWPTNWYENIEDKIEYLQAEEIEKAKQEAEQKAELEAETARQQGAEAERQRVERERQQAERERQAVIANITYKRVGNEITILGARTSFSGELTIPETIDGLQVTKIAPFAFYYNHEIDYVVLPRSIKEIGQGAFSNTKFYKSVAIPKGCIIGKNAFYNSNGATWRNV